MQTTRRSRVRWIAALATTLSVAVLAGPQLAHAHTDLDFTLPTDGASVGVPVDEVTVAFTSPVTLVGNGFEALDPQENLLQPFAVTDDNMVFRLQFDPPLAGGGVGVRYEVRAEDGHVISGSFSFNVDAAPPTTVPPTTPATVPATTPPESVAPSTATSPPVVSSTPATTPAVASTVAEPVETAGDVTGDAAQIEAEPGATSSGDDSDDGSSSGLIVIIAGSLAVGAAGFLLVRSRTGGG